LFKKSLSESDISAKYITPAVVQSGWDEATQIRREVYFTDGRIIVRGKLVTAARQNVRIMFFNYQHFAIAIIKAKDNIHTVGDGMQHALDYATTLDIPFVFSSNGDGFLFHGRILIIWLIASILAISMSSC
jgi:type I restriction enzyme, R subunit